MFLLLDKIISKKKNGSKSKSKKPPVFVDEEEDYLDILFQAMFFDPSTALACGRIVEAARRIESVEIPKGENR